MWLAEMCARQLANRGEPLEDLIQVAVVGVLKAVERFDPDVGVPFRAYASATVRGELRRHYRDNAWAVHVPRRYKDLSSNVTSATDRLAQQLGRAPTPGDIAGALGTTAETVTETLHATTMYWTKPMPDGHDQRGDRHDGLGASDVGYDLAEVRSDLAGLLAPLPERQRVILYLRYFKGMTQHEIGEELGVSQVHVSRLERAALDQLRAAHEEVTAAS
jgi:RNA polymerase sigma-B factor